jgi:predicted metal-binding protein
MDEYSRLEELFQKYDLSDYKIIDPKDIVVSQWVRMKCEFSCKSFGKRVCCPPNTPPVSDCRQFFDEYKTGVLFHFEKGTETREERHSWSNELNRKMLKLEREVFLSGYPKAFLLLAAVCRFCSECTGVREECKEPLSSRPVPEAMAIDVFTTARRHGYPIEVLTEHLQPMNRYSILLVE